MYESHITVEDYAVADFIELCHKIKTKPIIIEDDTGSSHKQMMTAKFHKASLEDSLAEMNYLASNFTGVVRRKLEKIIGKNNVELPPYLYLEFHTKYELGQYEEESFCSIVKEAGGHTARNSLKPGGENTIYRFATARTTEIYKKLTSRLSDFKRLNTIMEYVVYDDNPSIDNLWADCGECFLKDAQYLSFSL